MIKEEHSRTAMLIGEEALKKLQNAHVAVFGVGGVGSYICEALARVGVGAIDLFDNDTVSGSADITNAVSFVFNYQRAKDDDECDSLLSVTKNRMNGKLLVGDNAIKLYYSQKSKRIVSDTMTRKEYSCFCDPDFRDCDWFDDMEPL